MRTLRLSALDARALIVTGNGVLVVARSPLNDPAHWRARAIEARAVADQLSDPVSKAMMLNVAEGYEQLARRAEERSARPLPARGRLERLLPFYLQPEQTDVAAPLQ